MKKLITTLFIILGLICFAKAEDQIDNIQLPMRDYDGIELPSGTFIQVISVQDISTQYCPENYKVKFISTNDLSKFNLVVSVFDY